MGQHKYYDVLRGTSAFAVFIGHAQQAFFTRLLGSDHESVFWFGMLARYAVLVFLLLSGYLITQSIRTNIDRNHGFDPIEYLIARVARIYPPFVGALLLCGLIWVILVSLGVPTTYGLPTDLHRAREAFGFKWHEPITALMMYDGMLGVDGPLWTLYVEFQLYIAAMGVAAFFGSNRFRWIWSGLGFLALVLAMQHPVLVAAWLIGACANLSPIKAASARRVILVAVPIIVAVGIYNANWLIDGRRGILMQVACSVVLACVIFFDAPKIRWPSWLVGSADYSYSLYVIHWPLLLLALSLSQFWMADSWARTWIVATISVPSIVVFAILFASILERTEFFRAVLRALLRRQPAPLRP